jgi:hypothetical protein
MAQLLLADDLTEQISGAQAKDICQSVNQFFNQTEQDKTWELIYYSKNKWFLVSDIQLINHPMTADMMGKALSKPELEATLKSGSEIESDINAASYWIQTLNEIQMLLFSLPFNQQRAQQSKSQCNSLWLWGESFSVIPDKAKNTQTDHYWDKIYSDNFLVKQLADYTDQEIKSDYNLHSILSDDLAVNSAENVLIILDELEHVVKSGDPFMLMDVLYQYEQQWFMPLKKALLSSAQLSINIITNGEQSFQLNRRNIKSWWKRSKTTGKILESFS